MSSKNKYLIFNIILLMLLFLLMIYSLIKPKIIFDLNGSDKVILEVGTEYKELGMNAKIIHIIGKNQNLDFSEEGTVDTNKIGNYKITYKAIINDIELMKKRTVIVEDTMPPIINVNSEEINVCQNDTLADIDFTVLDKYDGNITDRAKIEIKDNKFIITSKDSSENEARKEIKINYIDSEKPEIKLNGEEIINIDLYSEYIEYGATAFDSCDGDLTNKIEISTNVNTYKPGKYQTEYQVVDSLGNKSKITRIINVISDSDTDDFTVPVDATIYLTFDDGPNENTKEILKILDDNKIKATFFVTNQFPKYQYLIKEEYQKGHTIGVHTYSHRWNVYNSIEDYMNDFNAMNQIIYEQTGQFSKIFRFPGGSSNTISKKYMEDIMTNLTTNMIDLGYQYYDWSIDSTDTARNNTVESIIDHTKRSIRGDKYYIILMHDIKANTFKALPEIIKYAKSIGYNFKAITQNTPIVHSKVAN